MRGLLPSLLFGMLCATVTPALATSGAYRTFTAQSSASCARACADDGLCIAWTLTTDSCALSAVTPTEWPQDATAIGLSARAPSFASLPQRPQILTPAPSPAVASTRETAPQDELEFALLGGRIAENDLRPRLGSR